MWLSACVIHSAASVAASSDVGVGGAGGAATGEVSGGKAGEGRIWGRVSCEGLISDSILRPRTNFLTLKTKHHELPYNVAD